VEKGDVLVGLDGKKTSGMKLEEIRGTLRVAGQTHKIVVEREGKRVEVTLKTREMLP
jgi:C-terminal processing protease CtpA/Prc